MNPPKPPEDKPDTASPHTRLPNIAMKIGMVIFFAGIFWLGLHLDSNNYAEAQSRRYQGVCAMVIGLATVALASIWAWKTSKPSEAKPDTASPRTRLPNIVMAIGAVIFVAGTFWMMLWLDSNAQNLAEAENRQYQGHCAMFLGLATMALASTWARRIKQQAN